MKYDFDRLVERRGTSSIKWKVEEGELPMWVADMDFQAAPEILDELRKMLEQGVFGYSFIPDEWYGAYMEWWGQRHGLKMQKEWLLFCSGVMPAISSVIRRLSAPGDRVLIQTPVYNAFFNCITANGRIVLENPLIYNESEHSYSMDFEDLERKLSEPGTTLMLLCNPHNPVGRIWDREPLSRIGTLAKKHHVTVISDEIHCDITSPGKGYVPFASVSDECREGSVTCITPTKAFNLAGLQTAAVCVPDAALRERIGLALDADSVAEPNYFASCAAIAAFRKGGAWLDEFRAYMTENKRIAADFIQKEIPGVHVVEGDATYLLWIDVGMLGGGTGEVAAFIRKKTGLYVTDGSIYGKSGIHFLRMNVACPRSVCLDGLSRLKEGVRQFMNERGNTNRL